MEKKKQKHKLPHIKNILRNIRGVFTAIIILILALYVFSRYDEKLHNKLFKNRKLAMLIRPFEKMDDLPSTIRRFILQQKRTIQAKLRSSKSSLAPKERIGKEVGIFFKDGSVMVGELLYSTEDQYVINYKGEETFVWAEMVEKIDDPNKALAKKAYLTDEEIFEFWPFENDVAIRLRNQSVLDAVIAKIDKGVIALRHPMEGGGYIEQDLSSDEIEYLLFKPVENRTSQKIEADLKRLFPDMIFYEYGNFVIVTDSHEIWANEYKKTLRNAYTEIYFKFFDIFKDRKPAIQNFVVIFDDYGKYVEYALTDGVPGWLAAGYFNPDSKILYTFNMLGEKFSAILTEAIVGESGRQIDDIVEMVEGRVDKRYHIFIEGQAKKIRDKFWEAYSFYKSMFRESTLSTIRHEFTHEVFHTWGLQSVTLSKFDKEDARVVDKKKAFLEEKDYKKKAKMVKALIRMRSDDVAMDMKAANSWLAEGVATYCETDPPGYQNYRWLFIYQKMARNNEVYPIEHLTVYKMGSFPGVYTPAMLKLYAQSWAFVKFLMEKHQKPFMRYQLKMAQMTAEGKDDISWLINEIGKDLKTVQAEFEEYMAQFEEIKDPDIEAFVRLYKLFTELY